MAELALLALLGAWLLQWVVLLKTMLQALRMPQVHMALLMRGLFGWLALARVAAQDLISSSLHSLCLVVKL